VIYIDIIDKINTVKKDIFDKQLELIPKYSNVIVFNPDGYNSTINKMKLKDEYKNKLSNPIKRVDLA
jgi:hypothetical protein